MENPPIHYLIADSSGHSVIVEFANGKMEVIENYDSWQVTTNFVISAIGESEQPSCWRYNTALETLSAKQGSLSESEALCLLQVVSVPETRWSTIYYLRSGQLHLAMGGYFENLHHFTVPNR